MRRGRGDAADARVADQVVCPICNLRNDSLARFCRNCGLPMGTVKDPVRGTRSRRPELPSERSSGLAAVVGLLVGILVLGGAGFLLFGMGSGTPGATPILPPTPVPTAGPSSDPFAPSFVPVDTPTDAPGPAESGTPVTTDTGVTCDPAGIDDPTGGAWRITGATVEAIAGADRVTLTLERVDGERASRVEIERMDSREAELVSGLAAPPTDLALLLEFIGGVELRKEIVENTENKAVQYLNVQQNGDRLYAVLGVAKEGCFRLVSPEWKKGKPIAVGDTARLVIDVRYR